MPPVRSRYFTATTACGAVVALLSGCAVTEPDMSSLPPRVIYGTGAVSPYPTYPPGTVITPGYPATAYPAPGIVVPVPVDGPAPLWVPGPPPAPLGEVLAPMPGAGWIWIGGYWNWDSRWVWVPGRWTGPFAQAPVWIAPRVDFYGGRHRFHPGYWSRSGNPPVIAPPIHPPRPIHPAPPNDRRPPPYLAPAPAPAPQYPPPAARPRPHAPAPPGFVPPPGMVVPPARPVAPPQPVAPPPPPPVHQGTDITPAPALPHRAPRERAPRVGDAHTPPHAGGPASGGASPAVPPRARASAPHGDLVTDRPVPHRPAGPDSATDPRPGAPRSGARPREDGPNDGNDARRY